jgi:glycerol-1-phosphate dehydrogenase [NAD(P)+]
MGTRTQIRIPTLVRIKRGALGRLGLYLQRNNYNPVLVLASPLPEPLAQKARSSVIDAGVTIADWISVDGNSFEEAVRVFSLLPKKIRAIVGIGGGKALDTAKYIAFLAKMAFIAVPTSLSNDGFCSPQVSLTIDGRRRSLPATMPQGIVLDVGICLDAPKPLWLSGVGDLVSKFTAVRDWKLAFHKTGEPVNDLAALLSDASVYQFLAAPGFDDAGTALLGTALMLNGIAMEICGPSRPVSGSEHLVSHALDATSRRPRLHGLQVGVASYVISRLQGKHTDAIDHLFRQTGFWEEVCKDPFSRAEWLEAVRIAPSIKEDFYTILSVRDRLPEVERMLDHDPVLRDCFTA